MRTVLTAALCGASYLCLSAAAQAQVVNPGTTTEELLIDPDEQDFVTDRPFVEESDAVDAIIVTARRREESVQEVPFVVNTVSAEEIAQLNLRDFDEVEGLVPGLSLEAQSFAGGASLRGVGFDPSVSGNNPVVEFYLNDTPVAAGVILQQIYDIGQIEVLRGPQGTLRGRASPSGSITITTRKPDLYEVGGYVGMTGTHEGGINVNGGIGVPLIEGVLAIRAAGVYDINEGNQVETIGLTTRTGVPETGVGMDLRDPYYRAQSGRVSAVFEPTEWLQLEGMYQRLETTSRTFQQVEAASIADPEEPESPIFIDADDRLAIQGAPAVARQKFDTYTWKGTLSFANQNLIYTGGYREQRIFSDANSDEANFFPQLDVGLLTNSRSFDEAHELRLQNEERIGGFLDYVVGVFRQNNAPSNALIQRTPIFIPGRFTGVNNTPITSVGRGEENSVFGNLTAHIGNALEISGGLRYIDLESNNTLIIGDAPPQLSPVDEDTLIYTAAANYFLNPDVMIYASTGTSFRPGARAIGAFSKDPDELLRSFQTTAPEESVSYEVGLKSTLMDGRLRFNIAGFYQDFENFPYRGGQTFFLAVTDQAPEGAVTSSPNLVAGVPVEVYGVEAEVGFEITPNWGVSAVAAYAKGEIKDGLVPCNDFDNDGVPDRRPERPSREQFLDATDGADVGSCIVNQRSGISAPFSASIQSEYDQAITPTIEGFARGLFTYYGDSQNDPVNQLDDVDAYGILNLYAGLRDPEGLWELSLYGKNVLDVTRVTSRSFDTAETSFFAGRTQRFADTSFREISTTRPQEFGLNLRVAFGSR